MSDKAANGFLSPHLASIGEALDQYLQFDQSDAMHNLSDWKPILSGGVPCAGIGIDKTIDLMTRYLIPNGSQIPKPGCSSFITTGAATVGSLASLAGSVASPQRLGLTAFSHLEDLSLSWLLELFGLPQSMQGVYSSGGSTANLLALGAARQAAFEAIGCDPSEDGVNQPCRVYASEAVHRTIQRSCAVLGLGRNSVTTVPTDNNGRICIVSLRDALQKDDHNGILRVAIVANAGSTDRGAIDPIAEMSELAREYGCWLHVDGAYGLPGLLDPKFLPQYKGLEDADSIIVDPHKWLGAPVGIGATFVKDKELLRRAFAQGEASYFEGSFVTSGKVNSLITNSMDSLGTPYSDFSVELSAPCRGAVVWALLQEIGKQGLRARICRHNAMAQYIADRARNEKNLELLAEPSLSICCFRYTDARCKDLNELNKRIHRQLVHRGENIPSTTLINGKLAIRPCFIGARSDWQQAENLIEEVRQLGQKILRQILREKSNLNQVSK